MDQKKIKGYTSPLCFSILYFDLSKYASHKKVINKLNILSELIGILNVDEKIIRSSLASDFNDSVQFFSALEYQRIEVILIRNNRTFKKSSLPVMDPEAFLRSWENIANRSTSG